ncbi:MAG: hypothetical protein ACK4NP_08915 [Parvularculaceae bacterium]
MDEGYVQPVFGFKDAAEMLERAWKFGGEVHAEHGFLFALRYGQLRLDEIEDAISKLALLPSAEDHVAAEDLYHFRRFVAAAWSIPLYLSSKRDVGIFDMRDSRHSAAWHGLMRAITRVLGPGGIHAAR